MRVLCVLLCYIMNEFGCNDGPVFKMPFSSLHIWLSQSWRQEGVPQSGADASVLEKAQNVKCQPSL